MRQKSVLIISWLLGGFILAGVGACSGDDDSSVTKDHQQTDVVKLRRLTITETEDDVASQAGATRAILKEKDGLSASWMAGDGLTYCNLSRLKDMSGGIYSGALTASSTARISQFTGNVTCIRGDYLAVVYPATTFVTNDSYSISLSGQDGTLETLASTFHYVYGKAHVESVTDETANATMMKMKSLLTVCKFSFKDKATNEDIPVSTLAISYGGSGSDQNSYPQSATVAISYMKEPSEVHATGVAGSSPLIVNASGQTEVYVALLPTSGQRTYNFTVTNPNGTYTGSAKATLTEGELVVATGLKLNLTTNFTN